MGSIGPQKKEKRAVFRLLFPLLISLMIIVLPSAIQLISTFVIQEPYPVAVAAEVNLSNYSKLDFQNTSLVGEIEFYPNAWIISESENVPDPVPFQTPGVWIGYPDGKGGTMSREGYGSYRYGSSRNSEM